MEYVLSLFLIITSLFSVDNKLTENWRIAKKWHKSEYGYELEAVSEKIADSCKIGSYLVLPQVVHGVHQITVDGKIIYSSGDSTFKNSSPFYYSPSIECRYLQGKEISWKVITYSKFFARLNDIPRVALKKSYSAFFDLQLNVISASALIFISLFSLLSFIGKLNRYKVSASAIGGMFLSVYAIMTVNSYLPINISMLAAHKIADICLSIGTLFYLSTFYKENKQSKRFFYLSLIAFVPTSMLIAFGSNGDIVQLGTTLQLPTYFLCLISLAIYNMKSIKNTKFNNFLSMLEFFSVGALMLGGANDVLRIFGVIDSYMISPFGCVIGLFFHAAAANQDINKTYVERDDLVRNLKLRVQEQTTYLTEALEKVKKSQAELVQSARLASLGTLSAGIAHEINNAINFVNGAIVPLERKIQKYIPVEEKAVTNKLFEAVKHGTSLTVDIVRSLRNFTGLNQSKVKNVSLKSVVESVLTILKSKLSKLKVENEIDENVTLTCYQVGLNQILMNLISNANDACPDIGGVIKIKAYNQNENVKIEVSDNGKGMSPEVKSRIFDAFFTTKEVGKGTGLGLHIVHKEIEKHHGDIQVISEVGQGTKFIITLPKELTEEEVRVAS